MPILAYSGHVMSTLPADHSARACRAAKHPRVQHLITADEHSLVDLEMLLATLPLCSTGRVFVEVPDAAWISDIAVPARMTLTWLDRSRRTGDPGTGRSCAPGQALARAVTAWADEMLCDAPGEGAAVDGSAAAGAHGSARVSAHGTRVHLLGGFLGTADIADHLTEVLGFDASDIHTPERFGLFADH